jgi:Ubiquitin-2 like Rad60 SUMO-like
MCDDDNSSSDGGAMFSSPDLSDVEHEENDARGCCIDPNDTYGGTSVNGSSPKNDSSSAHNKKAIDPFKFKAVSFQKTNTRSTSIASGQQLGPNDRNDTRKRGRPNLGRPRQALFAQQQKVQNKRKTLEDIDSDDDDDDSDLEVWDSSSGNKISCVSSRCSTDKTKTNMENVCIGSGPKHQEVIELSSDDGAPKSVTKASTSNTKSIHGVARASLDDRRQQPPIDQCSSDDDSEKEACTGDLSSRLLQQQNAPLPADAADAMKRAREAQNRLTQAQQYHAHDIHVPVMESELIIHRRPPRSSSSSSSVLTATDKGGLEAAPSIDLGKSLQVTCRTQMHIKEEPKKRTQEVKLTIREREPLQTLFDKLFRELALPLDATLSMSFDGRKLEKHRTLQFYDMEDGDLIDCTAQAAHLLPTDGTSTTAIVRTSLHPAKAVVLGKRMKFVCRAQIKVTGRRRPKKTPAPLTSNLELREQEALSVLRDRMIEAHNIPSTAKVTMSFDGEVCDLEQTPTKYGMESDDMIDFVVEVTQLWLQPS